MITGRKTKTRTTRSKRWETEVERGYEEEEFNIRRRHKPATLATENEYPVGQWETDA
jgi:hypothetical protein